MTFSFGMGIVKDGDGAKEGLRLISIKRGLY
jgi:hypothetical protein